MKNMKELGQGFRIFSERRRLEDDLMEVGCVHS